MEPREFDAMFAVEDRHWWYRGLRNEIERAVRRFAPLQGPWLDAGCGTGGLLANLAMIAPGTGIDTSPIGLRLARSRGLTRLARASVSSLPFADEVFAVITSVDVLAHTEADAPQALREHFRCLRPGGLLVLQLPAFEALRGRHDDAVWTTRRHRKREVSEMLRSSGFGVHEIFYRNSLLFPVAAMLRLLARRASAGEPRSDVSAVAAPINAALYGILELDAFLRRAGLGLPFGLSVFCVARREDRIGRPNAYERGPG
ncbi:MAG: class I SAM-dependent methyltransferase [Thermoanaerobaculia bacterium]